MRPMRAVEMDRGSEGGGVAVGSASEEEESKGGIEVMIDSAVLLFLERLLGDCCEEVVLSVATRRLRRVNIVADTRCDDLSGVMFYPRLKPEENHIRAANGL